MRTTLQKQFPCLIIEVLSPSTSPQWLLTPATLANTLSLKSVGLAVAALFEGLDRAQAAFSA